MMRFPPKPGTLAKRVRTVLAAAGRASGRSAAALDDRPELGRSDGKEAGPVGRGYLEIVRRREVLVVSVATICAAAILYVAYLLLFGG